MCVMTHSILHPSFLHLHKSGEIPKARVWLLVFFSSPEKRSTTPRPHVYGMVHAIAVGRTWLFESRNNVEGVFCSTCVVVGSSVCRGMAFDLYGPAWRMRGKERERERAQLSAILAAWKRRWRAGVSEPLLPFSFSHHKAENNGT